VLGGPGVPVCRHKAVANAWLDDGQPLVLCPSAHGAQARLPAQRERVGNLVRPRPRLPARGGPEGMFKVAVLFFFLLLSALLGLLSFLIAVVGSRVVGRSQFW